MLLLTDFQVYNLCMSRLFCLIFFVIIGLVSCKSSNTSPPHAKNISPGMAHNLILQQQGNSKFKIIDVRTAEEFSSGHILNAINIDWRSNKSQLLSLNRNDTILLYCQSGRRSQLAMNYLQKNGYSYLFHMHGGIIQWIKKFNSLVPSPQNES